MSIAALPLVAPIARRRSALSSGLRTPVGRVVEAGAEVGDMVPRLRLTARGRKAIAAAVFLALVCLGGLVAAPPVIASVGEASTSVAVETVTVQPGQSLWAIAASVDGDRDIRDVLAEIQSLNGLEGVHVEPGQVLVVPSR